MIINTKNLICKLKELKLEANWTQIQDQIEIQRGSKNWPEISSKWVQILARKPHKVDPK